MIIILSHIPKCVKQSPVDYIYRFSIFHKNDRERYIVVRRRNQYDEYYTLHIGNQEVLDELGVEAYI